MTVAVVDPDEVVRTVLKDHMKALQLAAVAYDSLAALAAAPGQHGPTVIVLGPSESPPLVIERIEPLLASRPHDRAIMLVSDLSAEIVRSAFRAGVDDVVALSAEHTELLASISRSVSLVQGGREPAHSHLPVEDPKPSHPIGRVVTVFGTKGGTGKSVVAINLAVALARRTTEPVVLVDANLQFGDAAIMLQLRPEHTITEAVLAGDHLDADVLEGLLLRHRSTGLWVLAAPADPVSADQVGRAQLLDILATLKERFAFVVVDTSPGIEESTLVTLQAADAIVMLTSPDVMSLKNARLGRQTIEALGIKPDKVRLVLNEANTQLGLTRADVERAMRMKVVVSLPGDHLVAESVNRGIPLMLSAPSSKFALCIDELARSLRAVRTTAAQVGARNQQRPRAASG